LGESDFTVRHQLAKIQVIQVPNNIITELDQHNTVTINPIITAGVSRIHVNKPGTSFLIITMTPLKPAIKAEKLKTRSLGLFDKTITPKAIIIGRAVKKLFHKPLNNI
jgi:hypothetical protein